MKNSIYFSSHYEYTATHGFTNLKILTIKNMLALSLLILYRKLVGYKLPGLSDSNNMGVSNINTRFVTIRIYTVGMNNFTKYCDLN